MAAPKENPAKIMWQMKFAVKPVEGGADVVGFAARRDRARLRSVRCRGN